MVKMLIGVGIDRAGSLARKRGKPNSNDVAPASATAPRLVGTGRIGTPLTVDPGVWSGVPAPALTQRWQRDGIAIPGATETSYVPAATDDLAELRCVVTASSRAGSASAATEAVRAVHAAPTRVADLEDRSFALGDGVVTIGCAAAFAGAGLAFAAAPNWAEIDAATGVVTLSAAVARDAELVTVTATNSGGSVAAECRVTVAMVGAAPTPASAPSLSGTGKIGTVLTVEPGIWSGAPAPVLTLQWQRDGADIPGATGVNYPPAADDDLAELRCVVTASNALGSAAAATGVLRATYVAPTAAGGLFDEIFDQGVGPELVPTAQDFTGENLTFAVTGADAGIDPATGVVSLSTDLPLSGEVVTVTAANSGGSAASSFQVTVEAEGEPPVDPVEETDTVFVVHNGDAAASATAVEAAVAAALAKTGVFAGAGDIRVVEVDAGDFGPVALGLQGAPAVPGEVRLIGASNSASRFVGGSQLVGGGAELTGKAVRFVLDNLAFSLGDTGAWKPQLHPQMLKPGQGGAVLKAGGVWGELVYGRGVLIEGSTTHDWSVRNNFRAYLDVTGITGSFNAGEQIAFRTGPNAKAADRNKDVSTRVLGVEDLGGGTVRLYVGSSDQIKQNGVSETAAVQGIADRTAIAASGGATGTCVYDAGAGNADLAMSKAAPVTGIYPAGDHETGITRFLGEARRLGGEGLAFCADALLEVDPVAYHDTTSDFIRPKPMQGAAAYGVKDQLPREIRLRGIFYDFISAPKFGDLYNAPHQDLMQLYATKNTRDVLLKVENVAIWQGTRAAAHGPDAGGKCEGLYPQNLGSGTYAAGSYVRNCIFDLGGSQNGFAPGGARPHPDGTRGLRVEKCLFVNTSFNTNTPYANTLKIDDTVAVEDCILDKLQLGTVQNPPAGSNVIVGNIEYANSYAEKFPDFVRTTFGGLAELIGNYTPAAAFDGKGPIGSDGVWRGLDANGQTIVLGAASALGAMQPPVLTAPIPDRTYDKVDGVKQIDIAAHFTGATAWTIDETDMAAIDPLTGILTIFAGAVVSLPIVVTAMNAAASVTTSFVVSVIAAAATGPVTIESAPFDGYVFDAAGSTVTCVIILSGTGAPGAPIEVRGYHAADETLSTDWTGGAVDAAGNWRVTAAIPASHWPRWYRAQVRTADHAYSATAPENRTFGCGHVVMLMGQSELAYIQKQDSFYQKLAGPALAAENVTLIYTDTDNKNPQPLKLTAANAPKLNTATGAMANFLARAVPGVKFCILDGSRPGTGRRTIYSETFNDKRTYADFAAVVQTVRSGGSDVGALVECWYNSDSSSIGKFGPNFAPFYFGQHWDGQPFTLGVDTDLGGTVVDHCLWDVAASANERGRGLFARARTKWWVMPMMPFNATRTPPMNFTDAPVPKSLDRPAQIAVLETFFDDSRVQTFAGGIGVPPHVVRWGNIHPVEDAPEGIALYGMHHAATIAKAAGAAIETPRIVGVETAADKSYADVIVALPNGGTLSTLHALRGPLAGENSGGSPHYQPAIGGDAGVIGFEITRLGDTDAERQPLYHPSQTGYDGRYLGTAVIVDSGTGAGSGRTGRVRITPVVPFSKGEKIDYLRGGASAVLVDPRDMREGLLYRTMLIEHVPSLEPDPAFAGTQYGYPGVPVLAKQPQLTIPG